MLDDVRTTCQFKQLKDNGAVYCKNALSLNCNRYVTFKYCLECHNRDPDGKLRKIGTIATPRSPKWSIRFLFEKIELKRLLNKLSYSDNNFKIKKVEFDWKNSRIITCHAIFRGLPVQFKIRLDLKYPHKPPRCSDFSFEGFTGRHVALEFGEGGDFDMFRHACLGEIEKRWNSDMSIAQYLQLFLYYTAIEHFNQRI